MRTGLIILVLLFTLTSSRDSTSSYKVEDMRLLATVNIKNRFFRMQFCEFRKLFDTSSFYYSGSRYADSIADVENYPLKIRIINKDILFSTDLWSVSYRITERSDSLIVFQNIKHKMWRSISMGNCEFLDYILKIKDKGIELWWDRGYISRDNILILTGAYME